MTVVQQSQLGRHQKKVSWTYRRSQAHSVRPRSPLPKLGPGQRGQSFIRHFSFSRFFLFFVVLAFSSCSDAYGSTIGMAAGALTLMCAIEECRCLALYNTVFQTLLRRGQGGLHVKLHAKAHLALGAFAGGRTLAAAGLLCCRLVVGAPVSRKMLDSRH